MFKRIATAAFAAAVLAGVPSATSAQCRQGQSVVVYEEAGCVWCVAMNRFLTANYVPFTVVDVNANPGTRAFLSQRVGVLGTPISLIDGRFYIGYNEQVIRQALCLN